MHKNKGLLMPVCGMVILISVINVAGWVFDVGVLKSGFPGLPSMKINTAVCIILCAVVILLYNNNANKYFNTIIPLNLIVLVISLLTLFEYLFNVNLKIDEFMVKEHTAVVTPGRMAVTSAFCLTLLTIGFAFIAAQIHNVFNNLARLFFYMVALITFLAIVGYILNLPSLHSLTSSKSMALITAGTIFPLSLVYISLVPKRVKKIVE